MDIMKDFVSLIIIYNYFNINGLTFKGKDFI